MDAQRAGHRGADPDPARRRRLCLGVDARRRPRRRLLRPRARLDLRPADPSGHQHQGAHRHLLRRRSAHAVLLLRGGRPRRRTTGDRGRRRHRRRGRAVRLRHAARRHRLAGDVVRRIPAESGSAAARAQRLWARRTFVHHLRGARFDGLQGVLQPRVVLDLRAGSYRTTVGGAADPPDGRGRRRAPRAHDRADVDRRGCGGRGGPRAGGRRNGHRGAVATALRQDGAMRRRPRRPLLPRRALSRFRRDWLR